MNLKSDVNFEKFISNFLLFIIFKWTIMSSVWIKFSCVKLMLCLKTLDFFSSDNRNSLKLSFFYESFFCHWFNQ